MIKNPYKEILKELEYGLWEHDIRVDDGIASPYEYDDETFRACIKIFMSGMMWKLWKHCNENNIDMDTKEHLAEHCGFDIKNLIKQYTGIDSTKLYGDDDES